MEFKQTDMTNGEFPLTRKETYSASMVVFIGLFYFVLLGSALIQALTIKINMPFGLSEIKWLVSGALYVTGGILLFKKKHAGWVICTAALLNLVLMVFMNVVASSQNGIFNGYAAIMICLFILMLMAFIFMFTRQSRSKFKVNNKSYLLTIALYFALVSFTYLL